MNIYAFPGLGKTTLTNQSCLSWFDTDAVAEDGDMKLTASVRTKLWTSRIMKIYKVYRPDILTNIPSLPINFDAYYLPDTRKLDVDFPYVHATRGDSERPILDRALYMKWYNSTITYLRHIGVKPILVRAGLHLSDHYRELTEAKLGSNSYIKEVLWYNDLGVVCAKKFIGYYGFSRKGTGANTRRRSALPPCV